jgi:hypothetical protein
MLRIELIRKNVWGVVEYLDGIPNIRFSGSHVECLQVLIQCWMGCESMTVMN